MPGVNGVHGINWSSLADDRFVNYKAGSTDLLRMLMAVSFQTVGSCADLRCQGQGLLLDTQTGDIEASQFGSRLFARDECWNRTHKRSVFFVSVRPPSECRGRPLDAVKTLWMLWTPSGCRELPLDVVGDDWTL